MGRGVTSQTATGDLDVGSVWKGMMQTASLEEREERIMDPSMAAAV